MVEKSALPAVIIKYRGIVDFDGIIAKIYEWCVEQGLKFHENTYKHKIPNALGAEQKFKFTGDRRVTGYIKYEVNVKLEAYELKEVDVIKDGKKQKLYQARIFIEISGNVLIDYNNRFTGNVFIEELHKFFLKYVYKHNLSVHYEDMLYYRMYKLHKILKDHLDMETKSFASEGRW